MFCKVRKILRYDRGALDGGARLPGAPFSLQIDQLAKVSYGEQILMAWLTG